MTAVTLTGTAVSAAAAVEQADVIVKAAMDNENVVAADGGSLCSKGLDVKANLRVFTICLTHEGRRNGNGAMTYGLNLDRGEQISTIEQGGGAAPVRISRWVDAAQLPLEMAVKGGIIIVPRNEVLKGVRGRCAPEDQGAVKPPWHLPLHVDGRGCAAVPARPDLAVHRRPARHGRPAAGARLYGAL